MPAPVDHERLILANIERARAIPARAGRFASPGRHRLGAAGGWSTMAISPARCGSDRSASRRHRRRPPVTGAGLIRYAVFRSYWNRCRRIGSVTLAPAACSAGAPGPSPPSGCRSCPTGRRGRERWRRHGRTDWGAVASKGRRFVNLRQRPGLATRMMGEGQVRDAQRSRRLYLHDTPLRRSTSRAPTVGPARAASGSRTRPAGARWLFQGEAAASGAGAAEQRVRPALGR